ncbi:MAG: L-tyrosine/L-tryptophan isonitrile synthase family protein [Sciscionella sp.]
MEGKAAHNKQNAETVSANSHSFRLITKGHRAIELAARPDARLYTVMEFLGIAQRVSPEFWLDTFIPMLRRSASENVASRLTAAAKRARASAHVYGVSTPGAAEVATEILFDRHLVKPREQHRSRASVQQHFRSLRESKAPLRIGLPLFSRKPVSPIKNRGPYPDLAEIASMLRCYQLAAMLSQVHDTKTEFLIFADGVKYRRACETDLLQVRLYQDALRYWCDQLGISDLVQVIDYEDAVCSALGVDAAKRREAQYEQCRANLSGNYEQHFDPYDPARSLATISQLSPLGEQLSFTFRSIASSVCYQTDGLGARLARCEDQATRLYLTHLANLLTDLRTHPHVVHSEAGSSADDVAISIELRAEAWQAAIRYVAISLVDRALDVWSIINPGGVKMTTHGKPGEIQIRPTRSKFMSMTAQHCVGGILRAQEGSKITFSYRLEHESCGDVPLLFDQPMARRTGESVPNPIRKMTEAQQPICYLRSGDGAPWEILSDCIVDF